MVRIPEKIKIFFWLVRLDRVLMQQNIVKKGWPHLQHCVMCKRHILESNSHLPILPSFQTDMDTKGTQINTTVYNFWMAYMQELTAQRMQNSWDCLCMATYWNLWKERNRCIFHAEGLPLHNLRDSIQGDATRLCHNG
jgi:zinc-binding in reverse transcriptase